MRVTEVARAIVEASQLYTERLINTEEFFERVFTLMHALQEQDDYDDESWREILRQGGDFD